MALNAADASSDQTQHLVEIARAALRDLSAREQDDYAGPFEPIYGDLARQLRSSLTSFVAAQGVLI